MDNFDTYWVAVYPDGEIYDEPPEWKSDDFEWRQTTNCAECEQTFDVHYGEPFASCQCGTTEWHQ